MAAASAVHDRLGMHTTTFDVGCEIEIRPLTAADREGIANPFSRLSEQTRRRRFLAYVGTDNFRVTGWITRADGVAAVREGDTLVCDIALDGERRAAR
jgi:hypothetical protein